jgi:hypothetical protein
MTFVDLIQGKEFWEGKPFIDHVKINTHWEADMDLLGIIACEITEHFYATVPQVHDNDRIRKRRQPRRASNLCMIDTKRQDLSLPRFLAPCAERAQALLTEWAGRKTESATTVTLLDQQTPAVASFTKDPRIFIGERELFAYGMAFPHVHVCLIS